MRSARFGSAGLAFVVALMWASKATGQPTASSLADLNAFALSKTAIVTSTSGQEFRGTVTDASESGLSLRVGNEIRRFAAADVRLVRVRHQDSPLNGALIGAGIAGALTALIFLDNECRNDPACYQALAGYTGAGALAGLGIDALIHRHVTIYAAPLRRDAPRLAAAPWVARTRRGVRLTITF